MTPISTAVHHYHHQHHHHHHHGYRISSRRNLSWYLSSLWHQRSSAASMADTHPRVWVSLSAQSTSPDCLTNRRVWYKSLVFQDFDKWSTTLAYPLRDLCWNTRTVNWCSDVMQLCQDFLLRRCVWQLGFNVSTAPSFCNKALNL